MGSIRTEPPAGEPASGGGSTEAGGVAPDPGTVASGDRTAPAFAVPDVPETFGVATWVVVVVFLLCAAQVVVPDTRPWEASKIGWIRSGAYVFVTLLFTLGPAWLFWRFGGRRRRRATIACVVGLVFAVSGVAVGRQRAADEVAAWEDVEEEMAGIRSELRRVLSQQPDGGPVSASRLLDRMAAVYGSFSQQVKGDFGRAVGAMAEVTREMATAIRASEAALAAFLEVGGLDVSTFPEQDSVVERLARVDVLIARQADLDALVGSWAFRLRETMRQADVRDRMIEQVAREFERGMARGSVAEWMKMEAEGARLMRELLVLLQERWSRWRYVADENSVEFDDEEARQEYDRLTNALADVAQHEVDFRARRVEALAAQPMP
ncbi:MAG: hypothetical protein HY907_23000 [Deltaproteobacteria bacterium]|nr:hypothetical protein [Deltaproteobacteria bacterium]